jgi:branched-chain amino acid transport system substrate-binding protein
VNHRRSTMRVAAMVAAFAVTAGACGSSDDGASGESTPAPAEPVATEAPASDPATSDTAAGDTATDDTATDDTTDSTEPAATEPVGADDPHVAFGSLEPPTGTPMVVGLSNIEGAPGLDFPDVRAAVEGGVEYLNQHGGFGGRPIVLETCIANGSPEGSQACAQELVGKDVELVFLGVDLFADYATYGAADVPVLGVLPILPTDYAADALFLTGGNVTVMAATALAARDHFGATKVGIVHADNPGSNSSAASLTASLDALGLEHVTVKGGEVETDAGFQGLMREVTSQDPDLLVSLYADAGCIGMMRARVSLAIDTPVIATGICGSTDVIDQAGDDALGWSFVGVTAEDDSPANALLQEIMAPVLDVAPEEVDRAALGLGALGLFLPMSTAVYANEIAAAGDEVTGRAIFDHLQTAEGLRLWPGTSPIDCGAEPDYPSICSFTFPFAEYTEDGKLRTIEGLEALSVLGNLP